MRVPMPSSVSITGLQRLLSAVRARDPRRAGRGSLHCVRSPGTRMKLTSTDALLSRLRQAGLRRARRKVEYGAMVRQHGLATYITLFDNWAASRNDRPV